MYVFLFEGLTPPSLLLCRPKGLLAEGKERRAKCFSAIFVSPFSILNSISFSLFVQISSFPLFLFVKKIYLADSLPVLPSRHLTKSIINLISFPLFLFVKKSISLSLSSRLAISLSYHLAKSILNSLFTVRSHFFSLCKYICEICVICVLQFFLLHFPERSNSHSSSNTQCRQSLFRFSAFHFVQ